MKTFNLFLVVVLALGVFAFMPQTGVVAFDPPNAFPLPEGTVPEPKGDPSGYDMADCSEGACKLMNGYNFISVPAGPYKVHAQTLTSVPGAPAGLKLSPKPVKIYFNPADAAPMVTVCFPHGNQSGQVFQLNSVAGWLPLPTSFSDGLACATAWGGGTFAYFK